VRAALGERACIVPISYIMPPDLLPDPRTRVRATAEALTRANAHQRHRPVAFTDLCCAVLQWTVGDIARLHSLR
jgi:hypothetical protein